MALNVPLILRGARSVVLGALAGAVLGLVTFLPGELVATADQPGGATFSWLLAGGVAWATGRVGAVIGLIFFLIRRTLLGEVADPRLTVTGEAPVPAPSAEAPVASRAGIDGMVSAPPAVPGTPPA